MLCKTVDSRAGGKGKRKSQPLKQGGALAGFNAWFGSMSMMLYVWFPASWGPSVVEAIQRRNETWLAQNPVIRDPQMFNHSEVAMGPASRELTYKIQKWNVHSDGVHPILVVVFFFSSPAVHAMTAPTVVCSGRQLPDLKIVRGSPNKKHNTTTNNKTPTHKQNKQNKTHKKPSKRVRSPRVKQ